VNYLLNFPEGYTPTKNQEIVLSKIEKAFNSGKKFVICCAPTGSGKSFISKAISNSSLEPTSDYVDYIKSNDAFTVDRFGTYTNTTLGEEEERFGSFILTITKSLQDQYINLFSDIKMLKGKINYPCAIDPSTQVEFASCVFDSELKRNCFNCNICHYYNAKNDALTSKISVLNYSMFLSIPDHVSSRRYIICDEASKLEDELVSRYTKVINYKILKRFGYDIDEIPIYSTKNFLSFLSTLRIKVNEEITSMKSSSHKRGSSKLVSDIKKYSGLTNFSNTLSEIITLYGDCEFLIQRMDDGIHMSPINVDSLAKIIFDRGDKILLMSATIIDHANFAKRLGIKDYEYVEMESTFDPKKAPIYSVKNFNINYSNLKQRLPKLKNYILDIAKDHKNEKGIIHTHTMEITNYLRDNINDSRFIFRGENMTNEDIMRIHTNPNTKNSIIVSPSMTFGVDLKEDLARFQILVKAAFLPLNDERVKIIMESDKNWYMNKMLDELIQACGRGVRTKEDKCITYILDSNITDNVLRFKHKLPKHFLDRFV